MSSEDSSSQRGSDGESEDGMQLPDAQPNLSAWPTGGGLTYRGASSQRRQFFEPDPDVAEDLGKRFRRRRFWDRVWRLWSSDTVRIRISMTTVFASISIALILQTATVVFMHSKMSRQMETLHTYHRSQTARTRVQHVQEIKVLQDKAEHHRVQGEVAIQAASNIQAFKEAIRSSMVAATVAQRLNETWNPTQHTNPAFDLGYMPDTYSQGTGGCAETERRLLTLQKQCDDVKLDLSAAKARELKMTERRSDKGRYEAAQLPPPWTLHEDGDGAPFYYNAATGVSQWISPTGRMRPDESSPRPVQAGWKEWGGGSEGDRGKEGGGGAGGVVRGRDTESMQSSGGEGNASGVMDAGRGGGDGLITDDSEMGALGETMEGYAWVAGPMLEGSGDHRSRTWGQVRRHVRLDRDRWGRTWVVRLDTRQEEEDWDAKISHNVALVETGDIVPRPLGKGPVRSRQNDGSPESDGGGISTEGGGGARVGGVEEAQLCYARLEGMVTKYDELLSRCSNVATFAPAFTGSAGSRKPLPLPSRNGHADGGSSAVRDALSIGKVMSSLQAPPLLPADPWGAMPELLRRVRSIAEPKGLEGVWSADQSVSRWWGWEEASTTSWGAPEYWSLIASIAAQPLSRTACLGGVRLGHAVMHMLTSNSNLQVIASEASPSNISRATSSFLRDAFGSRFLSIEANAKQAADFLLGETPTLKCDVTILQYPDVEDFVGSVEEFMRLGGGGAGFPGEGMLIAGERGGLVIVDGAPCGSLRCKKLEVLWEGAVRRGGVKEVSRHGIRRGKAGFILGEYLTGWNPGGEEGAQGSHV